jgi:hypothetical protein
VVVELPKKGFLWNVLFHLNIRAVDPVRARGMLGERLSVEPTKLNVERARK